MPIFLGRFKNGAFCLGLLGLSWAWTFYGLQAHKPILRNEPQFIWAFWASWAFHGPGLLYGLEAHFLDPSRYFFNFLFIFLFFFSVFQNIPDFGPSFMGLSFMGLLPAIAGLHASNGHVTSYCRSK